MDKIILRDLHFVARHGVLPIETQAAQPFIATVELELPLRTAGLSDHLDATVDYCAVQAAVKAVIEGAHRKLIEALAESVAAALLAQFGTVSAVTVEILKPAPPVDFKFAGVAVRLRRERNRSDETAGATT